MRCLLALVDAAFEVAQLPSGTPLPNQAASLQLIGSMSAQPNVVTAAYVAPNLFAASGSKLSMYDMTPTGSSCQCCSGTWPYPETQLAKNMTVDANGETTVTGLAVETNSVYVLGNGGRLDRLTISPAGTMNLAMGLRDPRALVLDGTYAYWIEAGTPPANADAAVRRVPKAGGAVETLATFSAPGIVTALSGPTAFVWSDGKTVQLLAR